MLRPSTVPIAVALAGAVLCGCGRKEPAEPLPTQFSFTATNVVIPVEELKIDTNVEIVKADFNRDGVEDIALVESTGTREKNIVIYIRRKGGQKGLTTQKLKEYYKAGMIRRIINGPVVGLGTKKGQDYVDLVILYEDLDKNGSREMIHYQNDGKTFTEIF